MITQLERTQRRDIGFAYLLWLAGFLGVAGVHRFYMGRWISGLLWLCTGGLCMVGQIIDAIVMPKMIDASNQGQGW
jgi:TM2 domain-containing membrane protein YozV